MSVPLGEPQTSAGDAIDPTAADSTGALADAGTDPARPARFTGKRSRWATYAVLVAIGVELGLIGAFLSLQVWHLQGVAVPAGPVVAALANLLTGLWAVRITGNRSAGIAPALGWLGTVMLLSTSRSEGDLVVTNSGKGVAFLLVGALAWALAAVAAGRVAPAQSS